MRKSLMGLTLAASIAILSGGANAQPAADPTALIRMLSGPHGAEWPDPPKTDEEKKEVFAKLHDLFLRPRNYWQDTADPSVHRVLKTAFQEAGKFAVGGDGQLFSEARDFYETSRQKIGANASQDARVDLYQSLAHTGTPEAATWIAEGLSPENDASLFALEQLDALFSESPPGDGYHPNVGGPLEKRVRAKEWIKIRPEIAARIQAYRALVPETSAEGKRAGEVLRSLASERPGAPSGSEATPVANSRPSPEAVALAAEAPGPAPDSRRVGGFLAGLALAGVASVWVLRKKKR